MAVSKSSLTAVRAPELRDALCAVPLSVVFADGELLAALRSAGAGALPLVPPYHVSDDDAYLVLPDDIGLEIADIFADGDLELLEESLRDGVVALGSVERAGKGQVALHAEACMGARALLDLGLAYGDEVDVLAELDPVEAINGLEQAQITVASQLVDLDGLQSMLRNDIYAGLSWRVPEGEEHMREVQPTYALSKRLDPSRVGVEAALFQEYEELVMLLRPVALRFDRGLRLVTR
ncbi:MAG: hypothetical protein IT378_17785 [Sandaracinaceae bacterium]|nr:hypothetical protein [Sandaracinaceae bacterium]